MEREKETFTRQETSKLTANFYPIGENGEGLQITDGKQSSCSIYNSENKLNVRRWLATPTIDPDLCALLGVEIVGNYKMIPLANDVLRTLAHPGNPQPDARV